MFLDTRRPMIIGSTSGTGDPTLAPTGWSQTIISTTRDPWSHSTWRSMENTVCVWRMFTKWLLWRCGTLWTGEILFYDYFQLSLLPGLGRLTGVSEWNVLTEIWIVVTRWLWPISVSDIINNIIQVSISSSGVGKRTWPDVLDSYSFYTGKNGRTVYISNSGRYYLYYEDWGSNQGSNWLVSINQSLWPITEHVEGVRELQPIRRYDHLGQCWES